jgi:hypothetical protein
MNMKNLSYPEGCAGSCRPHCGVLAVAICADVPFETVFELIRTCSRHSGNWKGRTTGPERTGALKRLGVSYDERFHISKARYDAMRSGYPRLVNTRYQPSCTVATFAKKYADAGTTYMLRVGGHIVTVRDGLVADQSGIAPAADHRSAKQRVLGSIEILSINRNAPEREKAS